jgi:hypothetical protein
VVFRAVGAQPDARDHRTNRRSLTTSKSRRITNAADRSTYSLFLAPEHEYSLSQESVGYTAKCKGGGMSGVCKEHIVCVT